MGYDVFTRRKDKNAPRWSQCYELVSQLMDERGFLKPLFEAPVEVINNREIRRFNHNDSRLETAAKELDLSLQGYIPTNKYEEA